MNQKFKILTGLSITVLLSSFILLVFYGNLLKSPNSKYFSKDGDGLKSYYVGTYHIKYDSSYFRSQAMNYPFGESAFFTDCHPLVANSFKFVSKNITDVSDYFPAAINLLMLISLVIACMFMYLIFIELKLPWFYAVIPSIAIVFLSPQIDRMGGHFSFSYHFVLPMGIYLLLRFYKTRSIQISIFIALLLFFGLTSHQYLFAFCSIFLLSLWLLMIIEKTVSFKTAIVHFSVQFILPLLFYSLILSSSTDVTDRTSHPWGFLYYRAYPESVFLPFGKPYGRFLYSIFKNTSNIDWEGYAYIGLVAGIGFVFFVKKFVQNMFRRQFKDSFILTGHPVLNMFFWASLLALLYSFGIPYILKMEFLQDYIGVLRQMRGLARFAWLFYYMMNILTFYWIWKWFEKNKVVYIKALVIALAFGMILYDAWLFNRGRQNLYNNEIPEFAGDSKPKWLESIEKDKYQAIFPIPYFNVGSENLWIGSSDCSSLFNTFLVSQKTGLPTNGVMLSRTSISQCYDNIKLSLEPYRKPEVLSVCKSTKPFLLLVNNCGHYSEIEQDLINSAVFIDSSSNFKLYNLAFEKLLHASDSLFQMTKIEIENKRLFSHDGFLSSNETLNFICQDFDSLNSPGAYNGSGAYTGGLNNWNTIFDDTIPNGNMEDEYVASFWFGNFMNDVQPRTNLILAYYDAQGKEIKEDWLGVISFIKILDNNWGLCEVKFKIIDPKGHFRIILRNDQVRKGTLLVDELLIRPVNTDVYFDAKDKIIKNNRIYLREK